MFYQNSFCIISPILNESINMVMLMMMIMMRVTMMMIMMMTTMMKILEKEVNPRGWEWKCRWQRADCFDPTRCSPPVRLRHWYDHDDQHLNPDCGQDNNDDRGHGHSDTVMVMMITVAFNHIPISNAGAEMEKAWNIAQMNSLTKRNSTKNAYFATSCNSRQNSVNSPESNQVAKYSFIY